MPRRAFIPLTIFAWASACTQEADSQAPASPPGQQQASAPTKLEAFKPAAGTIVTVGYDELGAVKGISVDVRELRAGATTVRGLVVQVTESQYRDERSFVDADEVAELIRGVDALLEVKGNPTSFKNFEVRYTTRGDLQLTAFNSADGSLSYAVRAGRVAGAQRFITAADMQRLRGMLVAAQAKLRGGGSP